MMSTVKFWHSRFLPVAVLLAATSCSTAGVEPIRSVEELKSGDIDGFNGAGVSSYYGGRRYDFEVSCKRLESTPAWEEGQPNPPLAARTAVKIARAQQERLVPKGPPWLLREVLLTRSCSEGHWLYEVHLVPRGVEGINIGLDIPVLMTGETIEPRLSAWPPSPTLAASSALPAADVAPTAGETVETISVPVAQFDPDAGLRALRKEWELKASVPSFPAPEVATRPGVSGLWLTRAREGGAWVALTRRYDGLYEMEFWSGGSLGRWHLSRLARYERGILTLNFPVEQYPGKIFQRFFVVSVDGDDYLLPEPDVPSYLESQHSTDPVRNVRWYAAYMLHYVPRD